MLKSTGKSLPRHIGVIMDGNGRWAKRRGLPRTAGHRFGVEAFEKIVRHANKAGLEYLTVYAFSCENKKRPKEEVDQIISLLREYLDRLEKDRNASGQVRFLGDLTWLEEGLCSRIKRLERESAGRPGLCLNIAFNYGGRDELLRAAKKLARDVRDGKADDFETIGEDGFSSYLYTAGLPDVDLVIRTSGEKRISNFLIWQSAYAEYIFVDTLWPDFTPKEFDEAVLEYARRNRRLGGI